MMRVHDVEPRHVFETGVCERERERRGMRGESIVRECQSLFATFFASIIQKHIHPINVSGDGVGKGWCLNTDTTCGWNMNTACTKVADQEEGAEVGGVVLNFTQFEF